MIRVVVEGAVSRAPELLGDTGELWWAVVSVDARPDYWGRPTRPERTVFRVRSRGQGLPGAVAIGDTVRVAGVLYAWVWYDRRGVCRHVLDVVGDEVELVDCAAGGGTR